MKKKVILYLIWFFPFLGSANDLEFSYSNLAQLVLSTYPEIQKSLYDVDIAMSEELSAKYSEYPKLTMTVYGFPLIMNVHYGVDKKLAFDFSDWKPAIGSRIALTLPVYTFGRIPNIKKATLFNRLAKEQDVLLTQIGVKSKVKELYWGYLGFNSFKKYVFDVILPEMEKDINEKESDFNLGKVSRYSLEKAKIDFLEIKTKQLELNNKKSQLDTMLIALTNKNIIDPLTLNFKVKDLYAINVEIEPFEHYLNIAQQNHPILKKGEFLAQANASYTEYEKASNRPLFGFGLSGGYNYFDFKYPTGGDRFFPINGPYFNIGFTFDWNLSFWETNNKNQKADSKNLKNLEDVKMGLSLFETELKTSYDKLILEKEKLSYQKQMLQIAQRSSIFISNAKKTGVSSDKDFFSSLKDLFNRLSSYYQQILTFNLAVADFEKKLGQDIVNYHTIEYQQTQQELFSPNSEDSDDDN